MTELRDQLRSTIFETFHSGTFPDDDHLIDALVDALQPQVANAWEAGYERARSDLWDAEHGGVGQ